MRSVLVVAAHPDDEALGCGGTLAKLHRSGVRTEVVFLADGVASRKGPDSESSARRRRSAAQGALDLLGVSSSHFEDFPDNALDTVPLLDIVQCVERHVARLSCDTVLTHHAGDLNVDHRIVQAAVLTACRPQPGARVKTILSFEVPSSTEWQGPGQGKFFEPNWFMDITDTLPLKMQALQLYAEEMRPWPHARSLRAVEHLARWRGACVGVEAAEAFLLCRTLA
jgi:N-acetylglucosamine malate deacetylase 1